MGGRVPRHAIALALGLLGLAALAGCYRASSYTGDGSLTDNGWRSYALRYVLDLGRIDLSQPGTHAYTLANLPDAEFTIGIETGGTRTDQRARVRVELKSITGEIIVLEEDSLDQWTWMYGPERSYLYRGGDSVDVRIAENLVRPTRIGVKASGGWGTYFNSEQGKSYTLRLEVLEPDRLKRPARLVLHGWDR